MSVVLPQAGLLSNTVARVRGLLSHVRLRPFDTSTAEGRAAERHRRVVLAALASALAKVISVSTGLISVPLTLHYLGTERYGMWMAMSSLASLLSFADFGLGNGLLSAVASAHGRDDTAAIRRHVSSGMAVLTGIACVLLLAFALVYPHVAWHKVFNVQSEAARREAGPALAAFFACFALALPTGVVQRVQMGLQRGFMASLWQCSASVIALIGVLVAIHLEAGLPWLVLAFVGAPLFAALLNSLTFFVRLHPEIAPRLSGVARQAAAGLMKTGGLYLVLQLLVALCYSSDSLVITQTLGAAAVAQYAVPEKLFQLISTVMAMVLAPLWPAYGEAIARGDREWVLHTLKRSLLIAATVAGAGSAFLIAFGPFIIHLWVGKVVTPPLLLLVGMGAWKVLEGCWNAVAVYLNGAGVVRFQVLMFAVTCVVTFSLKFLLIDLIGIAGAIWASVIAFLVCAAVPAYLVVRKQLSTPVRGAPAG